MQVIETKYHFTFTDYSGLPIYCCADKCKKAWWQNDIKTTSHECPQCGSQLKSAVENADFKVIQTANRPLKVSDMRKFGGMSNADKKRLQHLIQRGVQITNLGLVKPEFEEKAKKEWSKAGSIEVCSTPSGGSI